MHVYVCIYVCACVCTPVYGGGGEGVTSVVKQSQLGNLSLSSCLFDREL